MVDEAHGGRRARRRAAPGACELFGVEDQVDLRMGTFSKSARLLRRLHRRPGRRDRVPAGLSSRAFIFTAAGGPGRGRRRAGGAADRALGRGPRARWRRCLRQRRLPARGPALGAAGDRAVRLPDGAERRHPDRPRRWSGEDWKAVLLWKALFDAGVYTNAALHPAVPLGGALLRTSVMATHEDGDAGPRASSMPSPPP